MAGPSARRVAGVVLLAAWLAGGHGPAHAQMTCDPCAVGVVFDGPWGLNPSLRAGFEQEIAALAAPRHEVVFPPEAQLVADWTLDGAREAVEALLADPDVDIVLTVHRRPLGGDPAAAAGGPGWPQAGRRPHLSPPAVRR